MHVIHYIMEELQRTPYIITDPEILDFIIEADNNGVLLWKPATANGIEQVDKKPGFQIYPNPAGNELHILSEQTMERIEVYDVTGKLQISDTYSVVDISGLSQGIYVIKAFNATGMDTRKFIKQ